MYVFSFFAELAEFVDWARNLAKFLPLLLRKQLKYYFRDSKNKYYLLELQNYKYR